MRGVMQQMDEHPTRHKSYFITTTPRLLNLDYDNVSGEEDIEVLLEGISLTDMLDEVRDAGRSIAKNLEDLNFCVEKSDMSSAMNFNRKVNRLASWLCEPSNDFNLGKILPLTKQVDNTIKDLLSVDEEIRRLHEKYKQKLKFLKEVLEWGFDYCTGHEYKKKISDTEGHVLSVFISVNFDFYHLMSNIRYVLDFMKKTSNLKLQLIAVDCDLGGTKKESVIEHYRDGTCLVKDVRSVMSACLPNMVDCFGALAVTAPNLLMERALFKVPCPVCKGPPLLWTCKVCSTILEYCCNGLATCGCGWLTPGSLKFRCCQYFHFDFDSYDLEDLHKELYSIRPAKQINILLVGQSGAGKSTWINGFVNYLKYSSFDDAMAGEIISLVPMQFNICDEQGNPQQVCLKGDGDEDLTTGASATQSSRSYILYQGKRRIALVDTPGLGDTRGYERDILNVKDVVTHLKSVPMLHGICFVLLPNETRLNVLLRFVFQEVILNLHRKAAKNLFFLFTNTRTTNYRPGSSLELVKQMTDNLRVKFNMNLERVYSFDNEAFRFLAALKLTTIHFSKDEINTYKDSWKFTSKEIKRLLDFIESVEPYESSHSIALFNAHSALMYFSTKELEAKRLKSVDNLEKAIDDANKKIERLNTNLFELVQTVVKTNSSVCRLVCAASNCTKLVNNQKVYSKTCLNNFEVSPSLRNCRGVAQILTASCMKDSKCTVCQCIWEEHIVIDFEQNISMLKTQNQTVANDINRCKSDIKIWTELKEAQLNQGNQINTVSLIDNIAEYIAKYSALLYNDASEEYLSYLIDNEVVLPNKTNEDFERIERLKEAREKMKQIKGYAEKNRTVHYVIDENNFEDFSLENMASAIPEDQFINSRNFIFEL